ncbi:Endogenous retrovirus group V member 2 Env polyprotein, partial [Eudyptes schlegeli]
TKEGGVCTVINSSCCTYVDNSQRISADLEQIWQQMRILHLTAQDDTSSGFSELWEKLTSWLPNLTWLKQLFVIIILSIVLGILSFCMLQCSMWMCKQTGSSYEEWKQHKLRQKLEDSKYFAKT